MSLRWLLAGPLAGLGAAAGVIAALPDTHHTSWWIAACGAGSGLAALIGLLPSHHHDTKDLTSTGINAETLKASRQGVVIGQQYASEGGIAVGNLRQSNLNATLQPARDVHIGTLIVNPNSPDLLPLKQRRIWNIPTPVSSFTGRQVELDLLHQQLAADKSAALVPTTAIYGLGGIGKTQLALAYASQWRAEYELGWWIPAETPLGILGALTELATALGLPHDLSPKLLASRVRNELSDRGRWLLVFDNALDYASISDFLPRMGEGHILITSRNPSWRGVGEPLQIDVMSQHEAVDFLKARTGEIDQESAAELADALGFLPLALEQAAEYANSFLIYHPHPVARYMEIFQERRQELLRRGRPLAYEGTVDATFSLSVDKIAADDIGAIRLLEICAHLAPEEIPLASLLDVPALLPPPLDGAAQDPFILEETMGAFLRTGILIPDANGKMSIHRLMQTIIIERLSEETRIERQGQAISLINALMPDNTWEPRHWPRCVELLTHAEAVVKPRGNMPAPSAELGSLLTKLGTFLWARGLGLDRAAEMHRMALAVYNQLHQGDHEDIARGMYDLAADLRDLGQAKQSQKLHESVLEMRQRLYPGDHPEIARSLNALAIDMSELGANEEARGLHERALAMRERLYSGDHPDLATSLNDLAVDLRVSHRTVAAMRLDRRALVMRQRLYGPGDHPEIAISLHNLASNQYRQLRIISAIKNEKAALKMFQRIYQGDHVYVAIALNDLAVSYLDHGLFPKAHELFKKSLAMRQRLYDGDHPGIVIGLNSLARYYRVTLRPGRARELDQQALAMSERLYQGDHQKIITRITTLAFDNLMTGRWLQAINLYKRASRMHHRVKKK